MARERKDCRGYEVDVLSPEERLAEAARTEAGLNSAWNQGNAEVRYDSVADYDPVLRSHCRLAEDRK